MQPQPKYSTVTVDLSTVDRQPHMIMSAVTRAMWDAGVPTEEIEEYCAELAGANADKVVEISRTVVNLIAA